MFEKSADPRDSKGPSLLRQFNIPVEHLDFGYVKKSTNIKELERILKVLRSGEEGDYPQLITCTEERLGALDPNNRALRQEIPAPRSKSLGKEQREELATDILEWVDSINNEDESHQNSKTNETFSNDARDYCKAPIRGSCVPLIEEKDWLRSSNKNPSRIKSWEYDKWDAFDVDGELNKMDLKEKQIAEWETFSKPRLEKEEKVKLEQEMKNLVKNNVQKPSFIQELDSEQNIKLIPKKSNNNNNYSLKKRFRIQIDDINLA